MAQTADAFAPINTPHGVLVWFQHIQFIPIYERCKFMKFEYTVHRGDLDAKRAE